MTPTARWITAILIGLAGSAIQADTVLDWNKTAIEAVVASRQPPPLTTRSMAIVHAAMYDAVNAIEGRYTPYRPTAKPSAGASAQAAAAGAAHAVLVSLFPDQRAALDSTLTEALVCAGESGESCAAGAKFGATVGAEMLAARANDGTAPLGPYRPLAMPGRYIPTAMPVFSDWARAKPFLMARPDQFRPVAPPPLASALWATDYNEIKTLGGRASTARTKEQTEVGLFWIVTGAPAVNPIMRELSSRGGRSLSQNARLFALAYLAMADSLIAVFDAKYHYEFWRPLTAVRNGDLDGNDATIIDLAWVPLVESPLHPEYPCAHCINAAAVGTVLEGEFGRDALEPFSMTSPTLPGVTRRWTRIADYVAEVSDARVWSGVHFRNSAKVGDAMGRAIGEMAWREALRPVK
jgi:hypothetical protein